MCNTICFKDVCPYKPHFTFHLMQKGSASALTLYLELIIDVVQLFFLLRSRNASNLTDATTTVFPKSLDQVIPDTVAVGCVPDFKSD